MSYYVHQNADLIAMVIEHHQIKATRDQMFWMKLDRQGRKMTCDLLPGVEWEIPESMVVT